MQTQAINPITGQPYSRYYNPGHDSGAITLTVRHSRRNGAILEASVRSFTQSNRRYLIEVNCTTGHVRCACEACQRAIKRNGIPKLTDTSGYCKHIDAWWKQIAETVIEVNAGKWGRAN